MYPETNPNSRLTLEFSIDGLNVYANKQALIDLREQLTWLINSPEDEYYHCHVLMHLENEESKYDGKRPRNAGVSFTDDVAQMVNANIDGGECVDLSFFVVKDSDLDDIQKRQK